MKIEFVVDYNGNIPWNSHLVLENQRKLAKNRDWEALYVTKLGSI